MLEILKTVGGVETHLVMSRYARMNIEIETTHTPQDVEALADVVHSVGRVLDLFDLDVGILKRWEGPKSPSDKPPENEEPDESQTPHKVFGIK